MGVIFFKIPRHKTFQYKPRYYDEQKEQLQERIKSIEQEMGIKHESNMQRSSIIRGSFRMNFERNRSMKKKTNYRLIIIILILTLLVYMILYR